MTIPWALTTPLPAIKGGGEHAVALKKRSRHLGKPIFKAGGGGDRLARERGGVEKTQASLSPLSCFPPCTPRFSSLVVRGREGTREGEEEEPEMQRLQSPRPCGGGRKGPAQPPDAPSRRASRGGGRLLAPAPQARPEGPAPALPFASATVELSVSMV